MHFACIACFYLLRNTIAPRKKTTSYICELLAFEVCRGISAAESMLTCPANQQVVMKRLYLGMGCSVLESGSMNTSSFIHSLSPWGDGCWFPRAGLQEHTSSIGLLHAAQVCIQRSRWHSPPSIRNPKSFKPWLLSSGSSHAKGCLVVSKKTETEAKWKTGFPQICVSHISLTRRDDTGK